jgi:hypothetical protein
LLEGEFAGGDTSSVIIASYQPHTCETGTYEWMTLADEIPVYIGDDDAQPSAPEWNWYCEGRANGWMPLPPPPERLQGEG